jgi:Ni/Co efflux regulator RcnB
MKSKILAALLIASLTGATGTAFAQSHNDDHGHDQPSHRSNSGHGAPHGNARGSVHEASVGGPGGPIPHNDWHKGERLPAEYRDRNYVVDNWHDHGLQAPPRGYQWVGVNGDYVLAAVATGVIANVLLSGH